jgi:hypothetical protein
MQIRHFTSRDLSLLLPLLVVLVIAMLQRSTAGLTLLELGLLVTIPGLGAWAVLVWRWTSRRTHVTIPNVLVWLLLFGVWSIVSIFPAIANGVNVVTWGRRLFPPIALVTVTLVTIFTLRSREHVSLLYAFLIGAETVAVLVPLFGLISVDLSTINNLQYLRDFGNDQHAGILMTLLLPAVFGYRHLNRLQQTGAAVGFIISLIGLTISFTRTMWIATAAAIGFTTIVYLQQRYLNVRVLLFGILFSLFGAVFTSAVAPDKILVFLIERMRSIPSALQSASLQDRIFELHGLLADAVENPLMLIVGHGWGAEFTFYSVNQYSWGSRGWTSNAYSHNYYAYLLWSIGIVGLAFFLRYWQLIFRDGLRVLLHDGLDGDGFYLLGCMGATVSLLVSSLTGTLLNDVKWCVVFGIIGGMLIYVVHDRPNENTIIDSETKSQ